MSDAITDLKEAFDGFGQTITEVSGLLSKGVSSYPEVYQVASSIHKSLLPIGYSLLTLYFLMEFLSKTMNFQFVKWETVIATLVKLVFLKFMMERSFDFFEALFDFSTYMTGLVSKVGSKVSAYQVDYTAIEAHYRSLNPINKVVFGVGLTPFKLTMWGIKIYLMVIALGRLLTLAIFTAVSPIPLATFISDAVSGTGKRFVTEYAAKCVQGLVIIVCCTIYTSLSATILNSSILGEGTMSQLWKALLAAVMFLMIIRTTDQWAKKLIST